MTTDRYYTVKEVNAAKALRKVVRSESFKKLMNQKFMDLLIYGSHQITEDELKPFKNEFDMAIKNP